MFYNFQCSPVHLLDLYFGIDFLGGTVVNITDLNFIIKLFASSVEIKFLYVDLIESVPNSLATFDISRFICMFLCIQLGHL